MRKLVSVLVCLWVAASVYAAEYKPFAYSAPPTEFRSTSAYTASSNSFPSGRDRVGATSSLTAISAANFATLNSEGGACYIPSATCGSKRVKVKEPEPDTEAIGEGVWESPVGETPLILLALLAAFYAFFLTSRSGRKARQ